MPTRIYNSSINLNVSNTGDGFMFQGGQSGWSLTVTSGDVNLYGGGQIYNGQLLIGSSGDNSFNQGNLYPGNAISITSGVNNIKIEIGGSGNPPPTVGLTLLAANAYGTNEILMGNPAGWLDIFVSGQPKKIPFY